MSGTTIPSLNIQEQNTGLTVAANSGEGVTYKLGACSALPYNIPIRCSTSPAINAGGVGPLVSSAGPHQEQSGQSQYIVRMLASIAGTFGAVSKAPATLPASPGSLATSAATFSARGDGNPIPGGAALNLTSGFSDPPSPLPLTIVLGGGAVAHKVKLGYYNLAGRQASQTISISGAGSFSTGAGLDVAQIISYETVDGAGAPIDPVGATTLSWNYAGPLERFDHLLVKVARGGQVSVAGAQTALVKWSADDGVTFSPSVPVPSTGVVDLYTYPGGFTSWHTGIRLTFTQNTVAKTFYGAARIAGATVSGDLVYTFAAAGATVAHVIPTVPTALAFSVAGLVVTLTAGTSGGVAASYGAFGGNLAGLTFTAAIVGTGGNAVTVQTVSDGTDQVTVVGNAITIHYNTTVTTVANVKAHFPVATTFGSVTATGGTNANVLADPGDTHGATNLAGGTNAAVTTTGTDAKNFFDSDTSPGTLQARQLIHALGTVGTGAGLLASAGATGAPDGGVNWTALRPGVSVRQVVSGQNTVEKVTAANNVVTVIEATDANGAQTSTPNSILAALAASADASALASMTVGGAGTGLAGWWSDAQPLVVALEEGDEWLSHTTPPQSSAADQSACYQALLSNFKKTLANIEHVHLVQDDVDNVMFQQFLTWLRGVKQTLRLPLWGTVQGLYNLPATYRGNNQSWASDFVTALPSPRCPDGEIDYEGGEQDTIVNLYGCQLAMSVATLNVARCMNVVISQSSSQPECKVLTSDGIQNALPGTGLHSVPGTDEKQSLWEDDDSLDILHAQNVTTNRTLPEYDGVFIRQSLLYVNDGNLTIYWERRRVLNRAFRLANLTLVRYLNADLLTDPKTGVLAEVECQQIEQIVRAAVNNGGLIADNGTNHVSGYDFQVSRTEPTGFTSNVVWSFPIVPLAKVLTLSGKIGFTITLQGNTPTSSGNV